MREKKEINIQIGERIKNAREQTNITQEKLAERINVSPQYVSDLERGVVGVSISTLKNLCMCLGVSSDSILFGSSPANDTSLIHELCKHLSDKQFEILLEIIKKYTEAVIDINP